MATAFRPELLLVPVITPFDEAGRVDECSHLYRLRGRDGDLLEHRERQLLGRL